MSVLEATITKPDSEEGKDGQRPRTSRHVYAEKHIYIFLIVLCLLQTIFLGSLLYFLRNLKIPEITAVASYSPAQATIIYDRHGMVVDRMFIEDRTVVPLTAMSPDLLKAFVAVEDGRFFEHPGLDFYSLVRAAVKNTITGARSEGGSTITQQVIKSLLLTPEKTYIRKFKEAILAWRIDKLMSKGEILHIYLNQIYLGEGAYGVEAASQIYFGKSCSNLRLAEAALLAGLPKAPSKYSLFQHMDKAAERQKHVLDRMVAEGYIGQQEAQNALEEQVKLSNRGQKGNDDNGYYLEVVKRRARAILGVPLQNAGVHIYTNLDSKLQAVGADVIRRGVQAGIARQAIAGRDIRSRLQGGLVCIETATGKVLATIGGTSFLLSPFDRATQARRQAGSTFKPFIYATALEHGWHGFSAIEDTPITIGGKDGRPWTPHNYGGRYHGMTTLADALTHSLNAATVRLMQRVGSVEVRRAAQKYGFSPELPNNLSLALGATEVSLLQITAAYLPFAGNGSFIEPSYIEKIVLEDNMALYPESRQKPKRILASGVVAEMRGMLRSVVMEGTGKLTADVPGVGGGKTGTTDDYRDAWFIGYDDRYTTGVWMGTDDNLPMGPGESGGVAAAPLWRDFMLAMHGNGQ